MTEIADASVVQTGVKSKEIPSAEYLSECFEYKDGFLFWKDRPRSHFKSNIGYVAFKRRAKIGGVAGCRRPDGYHIVSLDMRRLMVHRIIWKMHFGEIPQGKILDHIDINRGNNRIENLRLATISENGRNACVSSKKKSKLPKGVWKNGNSYCAEIKINYKKISLGSYSSIEEASQAYQDAAQRLHGEFARY